MIVTGKDNKILRTPSTMVKKVDKNIKNLIDDMMTHLLEAQGLGIAAPQIGINLRVVIVRMNFDTPHEMYMPMINPEIIEYGKKEHDDFEEGCLSLPGMYGNTPRALEVTVKYMDKKGKQQLLHLNSLNARIMQHEVDHINGMLFIDRLKQPPRKIPVSQRLKEKESAENKGS